MRLRSVFQMRVMMAMKMMIMVVIIIMKMMMQGRWLTILNIKTFICIITIIFKLNQKFEATVIKQMKNPLSIIKTGNFD